MIQKRTYRYITAFVFALAFCVQTFCSLFFIADYYINTNAFAANCINKDKPQMHCDGKCQLEKKINTEEKNDKQSPERKNDNSNEVLSSRSFFASVQILPSSVDKQQYSIISSGVPVDMSSMFFRPPKTAA